VRTEAMVKVMRDACASCWIVEDCREWALHHEPMSSSVWGGLTHDERKAVRRQRRIRAIDPLLLVEVSRASA
jgi:WhiB family redox-sensing transcriptional regulator